MNSATSQTMNSATTSSPETRSFAGHARSAVAHLIGLWPLIGLILGLGPVLGACQRETTRKDQAQEPLRIAAAADLAVAFEDLGKNFEAKTGEDVVFTFGSTGLLAKQIEEGAPFDVFAAANVSFVNAVVKSGRCAPETQALYGRGRIVAWVSKERGIAPPENIAQLTDPRFKKIAIANPEHAPYGQAAKEALTAVGIWDEVKPRLIYGENVRQALQYAESGNVEVAIVALSLATATTEGTYQPIAETLHTPLDQTLVVCAPPDRIARAIRFATYVNEPAGRAVMRRYGFLLPGEAISLR